MIKPVDEPAVGVVTVLATSGRCNMIHGLPAGPLVVMAHEALFNHVCVIKSCRAPVCPGMTVATDITTTHMLWWFARGQRAIMAFKAGLIVIVMGFSGRYPCECVVAVVTMAIGYLMAAWHAARTAIVMAVVAGSNDVFMLETYFVPGRRQVTIFTA